MTDEQHLSTTALAKTLEVSAGRLFALLQDYRWIERKDDSWVLLAKGEEQGGQYQSSKSFGRYIVWPETLQEHPLLQAIADTETLTASGLGQHFSRSARLCNRVLRELGWIRHGGKGWMLTDAGERFGGLQLETEKGNHYVSWPQNIIHEPLLQERFTAINRLFASDALEPSPAEQNKRQGSLSLGETELRSLDGHDVHTAAELELCQWLYLLDLTHAFQHGLGSHSEYVCDFYLPRYGIYIDIAYRVERPALMAARIGKQQWCAEHQLTLLELAEDEVRDLEEHLLPKLQELGIHVY